jgi:hypothetical protein
LFRAHPRQSTQKRLLLPVLSHSGQESLFSSQHVHCIAQSIYTLIYIYIVVGQSRAGYLK